MQIADPAGPGDGAFAIRISQGGLGPSPPLAGALAAWVLRAGGDVLIVDPRGAKPADESAGAEGWPLWAHLEAGFGEERIEAIRALDARELVGFGPGADEPGGALFLAAFPGARLVTGDPEAGLPAQAGGGVEAVDLSDLSVLPLTTYYGFGPQAGAFRLLAGRGDRARPVAAVVREIVYLVEMAQLGHVLFDDADLAAYPGWLARFEAELSHLPWRVTWEGTVDGRRRCSADLAPGVAAAHVM